MTCKKCFHHKMCVKEYMRERLTPKGYELTCRNFKNKADFVEVVRCKDCKHLDREKFCVRGVDGTGYKAVLPDDFCSYGDPKEREHESD